MSADCDGLPRGQVSLLLRSAPRAARVATPRPRLAQSPPRALCQAADGALRRAVELTFHGLPWPSMAFHGLPRPFTGLPWPSTAFHWPSTAFHGLPWPSTDLPRPSTAFHWPSTAFHGLPLTFHGLPLTFHWPSTAFHQVRSPKFVELPAVRALHWAYECTDWSWEPRAAAQLRRLYAMELPKSALSAAGGAAGGAQKAGGGCGSDPCKRMRCPAGWQTARHSTNTCRCVCARPKALR